MPVFNLPLDITKPAHELLVEAINEENRTSFVYTDFSYSDPEVSSLLNSDINTRIVLTPNVGSPYYNSREFYYRRMDIEEIYRTKQIEIEIGARVDLSELIDEINEFYGINLTDDDYHDTPLPQIDPLNPTAKLTVQLVITDTSVLFYGSVEIALNEAASIIDDDNIETKYYVAVALPNSNPDILNEVVCVKSDLNIQNNYKALRGTVVSKFGVDKMFNLPNDNIVIKGNFEFTGVVAGNPSTTYDVATVIMKEDGTPLVTGVDSDKLFGPEDINKWTTHHEIPYVYIIDSNEELGIDIVTNLYRYNQTGLIDDTYSVTGITYTPAKITLDRLGRLYTLSKPYDDAGTYKVRIDRLLDDGTLDIDFNPIYIWKTGSGMPLDILDIQANDQGGLYVFTVNTDGLSSIVEDEIPIVNGNPIVPGNESQVYSWNPVLKFTDSGLLDTDFTTRLFDSAPYSLYRPFVSTHTPRVLVTNTGGVLAVTNINNPITGYEHRLPISFDLDGKPIRLSGKAYSDQIRWTEVHGVRGLRNGKVVIRGTALLKVPGVGWSENPKHLVVQYLKTGEVDSIVYAAGENAGTPVVIDAFAVIQKVH